AQVLLGGNHFFRAEWRSVHTKCTRLVWRSKPDGGASADNAGLAGFGPGGFDGGIYLVYIHAIDRLHVPTDGFKTSTHILAHAHIGAGSEGDVVHIVEVNQLAELEVTGN